MFRTNDGGGEGEQARGKECFKQVSWEGRAGTDGCSFTD